MLKPTGSKEYNHLTFGETRVYWNLFQRSRRINLRSRNGDLEYLIRTRNSTQQSTRQRADPTKICHWTNPKNPPHRLPRAKFVQQAESPREKNGEVASKRVQQQRTKKVSILKIQLESF